MARSFNGTTQYCSRLSAVVSAAPLTMACWFYSTSTTTLQTLMELSRTGTGPTTDKYRLILRGDLGSGSKTVQAQQNPGNVATTTAEYSGSTWQHACGVFASTSSRTAYLNGGNSGTNTTAGSPGTLGQTICGSAWDSGGSGSFTNWFSGIIAEAAVWSVDLTASEVASLAKGYSPLSIRPASLVAYWPFGGHYGQNDNDHWKNGYDLTPYNSPTFADHCRVVYPALVNIPSRKQQPAGTYTAGPRLPDAVANDSSVGSVDWTNLSDASWPDSNGASVSLTMSQVSRYLACSDFKFNIPLSATINGATVDYSAKTDSSFTAQETSLRLIKGGTVSGTNKATSSYWSPSWTSYSRGGSSDLWGLSLTPADVNASTFGVALSVTDASMSACTAYVDYVTITVSYTVAATSTGDPPQVVQTRRRVAVRRRPQSAVFNGGLLDAEVAAAVEGGEVVVASFVPAARRFAWRSRTPAIAAPIEHVETPYDPTADVATVVESHVTTRTFDLWRKSRQRIVSPIPDTADPDPALFVVTSRPSPAAFVPRPSSRTRVTIYWPEDGQGVCECEPGGVVVVGAGMGVVVLGQDTGPEAIGSAGAGRALIIAGPHYRVQVVHRCDC